MGRKSVTVYTVQTVLWEYNDEFNYREDGVYDPRAHADGDPVEGGPVPVKAFLTRRQADAHRRALESEGRRDQNPFGYGGYGDNLADYTSLTAAAFTERLQVLGVEPPAFDRRGGCLESLWNWWDEQCSGLAPDLKNAVWDALDLVCFYQVVPMRVELEG
jgi:hypothetical protein